MVVLAVNEVMHIISFCLLSITKYDDPLKGICQGTIDFLTKNCRPPKLVDGVFEVWWHLRKFLVGHENRSH